MMLIFVRDIDKRLNLIKFAERLGQNHGILTVAYLQFTDGMLTHEEKRRREIAMRKKLAGHGFQAFCEVHAASDFHHGIVEIAKGHGLAGLRTNTLVFGWSDKIEGQVKELKIIRDLRNKGKNLLLCRFNTDLPTNAKFIDIWWGGQQNNGDLMLLCAYLLKLNRQWQGAAIRILSVVSEEAQKAILQQGIKKVLPKARIKASVDVIVSAGNFVEIMHKNSKGSDIVFLGLPDINKGEESDLAQRLDTMCSKLKATVFMQNNSMPDSIPTLLKV